MSKQLFFRVNDEELKRIESVALEKGLSPAQYCRAIALSAVEAEDLSQRMDIKLQAIKSEIVEENKEMIRKLSSFLVTHLKK